MKRDTKINISLVAMFTGMFYWMFSGHEIITASPDYEAFISQYRGGGFFSIGFLVISLTFFAAYFYPPIIWTLLCFEIVDRGSIKKILFNQESWYLWLAPVAVLLLISMLIVLRVVTSLAAHMLFIGVPIYLLFRWVTDTFKK
jgi:hypothetical protein